MARRCASIRLLLAAAAVLLMGAASPPEYSIEAIRYADSPGDSLAELVIGAPKDEKIDTVFVVWLVRGGGRTILFDSGFHRPRWFKEWTIKDYLRPDEAVRVAGVKPEEVTDVVISHAHWDHMGGIDLFPKATIWIQKDEFRYYTGEAWQPGGDHGGIDPDDAQQLVRLNSEGRLRWVDGTRSPRSTCASRDIRHLCWHRTTFTSIATSRNTNRVRPSARRTIRPISRIRSA
jgi:Metallo-beta-lactamase superfamily